MIKVLLFTIILYTLHISHGESGYNYPKPKVNVETIDTEKFVYYFKPPPDKPKPTTPSSPVPAPQKKKIFKYIFIQAPHFTQPAPIIPIQPQNEEKTIVYVLSKKEEEKTIFLPTPVPPKQLSPEVYYINYGAQKNKAPAYGQADAEDTKQSTNKPIEKAKVPPNTYVPGAQSASVEIEAAAEAVSSSPPSTSYGVPILPSASYGIPFNPDYNQNK